VDETPVRLDVQSGFLGRELASQTAVRAGRVRKDNEPKAMKMPCVRLEHRAHTFP